MKNLILSFALVLLCAACVDENYDLADLNTDSTLFQDNIAVPLVNSTLRLSEALERAFDYVNPNEPNLDLRLEAAPNGDYHLVGNYRGQETVELKQGEEHCSETFDLTPLYDFLDSENISETLLQIKLPALNIYYSSNIDANAYVSIKINNIVIDNNALIEPTGNGSEKSVRIDNIQNIINELLRETLALPKDQRPESLTVSIDAVSTLNTMEEITLGCELDLPLEVLPQGLHLTLTDKVQNAFSADMIKYLFNRGTVVIGGTIENTIGLQATFYIDFLDENGHELSLVGFSHADQGRLGNTIAAASTSTIAIAIDFGNETNHETIKRAKDIKLTFELETPADNSKLRSLHVNDYIRSHIWLKKTGGIDL